MAGERHRSIVVPYGQQGSKCPHALAALSWLSASELRCMHCGRHFTLAPFTPEKETKP